MVSILNLQCWHRWRIDTLLCVYLFSVQFEGSLGRLTASSVHNPRQIIDVKVKTNTGDEEGRHKEVRRFKQLLIHIEKVGEASLLYCYHLDCSYTCIS